MAAEDDLSERVVLNVGGTRFETYRSTLTAFPDTLLGTMFQPRNRDLLRPDAAGEYFFDRDPGAFACVMGFYRSGGRLFPPPGVNEELLREEVAYFQLVAPTSEDQQDDTAVFTWGRGEYGQLGHGSRSSVAFPRIVRALRGRRVKQLSLGTSHSAAISEAGEVFSWGYGGDGRLGHGNEDDQLVPKLMEALAGWRVAMVVCGELHTAAMTEDGRVLTWGLGKDGRLGHLDRESHFLPQVVEAIAADHTIVHVACGGLHTAALTANGEVLTWGLGKDGRLGHANEMDQLGPKLVETLAPYRVVSVCCGGHHTAALTDDGEVYTWGFDDDGRLGHSTVGHQFLPLRVEALAGRRIRQIACGCWHSAALSEQGEVFTWGSCKSGQLGLAHRNSVPTPRVVMQGDIKLVACGTAHTATVTADGELYTWGKAEDGRLGLEDGQDHTTPALVEALSGHVVDDVVCGVYGTAVLCKPASR